MKVNSRKKKTSSGKYMTYWLVPSLAITVQFSVERLSKICQGRHKFLLEAKIAAYKLYDISFLTLARKNEWVSDEVSVTN